MFNFYDIAYWVGLGAAAPYWLITKSAREKVLLALRERMGHVARRESSAKAIWIHAVSLGEINATSALIEELRRSKSELEFIVSTTTTTGYARGEQLYGKAAHVRLIKYPLDFSAAIGRALDALRPSVVVLMELEIWPNFVLRCRQRGIPMIIVNGRITEPSFRKYMLLGPVTKRMLRRIDRICVQDETYAARFVAMGALRETVEITGTMKFDTAEVADWVEGDAELAAAVGLKPGEEKIWVCGSTGPGEEEIVLGVYRELLTKFGGLRLAIIPRHPQRFDEVAELIRRSGFDVVRRSQATDASASNSAVVLGDTMGELRKFYSLADVVFVGRSLVDLGARQHGSDMIEPAALGKAVVVGPFTANFAEAMGRLKAGEAVVEVKDGAELGREVGRLVSSISVAKELGKKAQEVVREAKGATGRHVEKVVELVGKS